MFILVATSLKWILDKKILPLEEAHKELYFNIHRTSWNILKKFPNLTDCRDFNDRIQWLKLFDQCEDIIRCSDKILVREYIREKVGGQYLTLVYQICESFKDIDFDSLPNAFVIKTNHDSGSVVLVRNKVLLDKNAIELAINKALSTRFGWEYGEWAYAYIRRKVFVEEYISSNQEEPPPDYKFYVVNGQVKFIHYIYNRGIDTAEQTLNSEGMDLKTELYTSFKYGHAFIKPACWDEMKRIAVKLASDFKCVRVDLFESQGRIYVGELTFWPMFGCYKGEGQKILGHYLDFDRATFKTPIYHRVLTSNLK